MECAKLRACISALREKVFLGHNPFEANVPMAVYYRLSIPLTIVNIFGVYLIVCHSKTFLKPLKNQLLILQLVCMLGDFSIMELLQPTIYAPLGLAHMNGPLWTLFRIPPIYAVLGCLLLTCSIPPAIVQVILYKHQLLQNPGSRLKVKPRTFKYFMILALIISYICLSIFLAADYDAGPAMFSLWFPFLSSHISAPNAVTLYVSNHIYLVIYAIVMFFVTTSEVIFAGLLFTSCAYTINSRLSSNKTRKYEMKLLIALSAQLLVPMFTYAVPIMYFSTVFFFEIWFVQDYNNFITFFVTLHSFFSTLLMIYLNKPYREATKTFILKFPPAGYLHKLYYGKRGSTADSIAMTDVSRTTRVNSILPRETVPNNAVQGTTKALRSASVIGEG